MSNPSQLKMKQKTLAAASLPSQRPCWEGEKWRLEDVTPYIVVSWSVKSIKETIDFSEQFQG
jgi:hypothetical protein